MGGLKAYARAEATHPRSLVMAQKGAMPTRTRRQAYPQAPVKGALGPLVPHRGRDLKATALLTRAQRGESLCTALGHPLPPVGTPHGPCDPVAWAGVCMEVHGVPGHVTLRGGVEGPALQGGPFAPQALGDCWCLWWSKLGPSLDAPPTPQTVPKEKVSSIGVQGCVHREDMG